MELPPHLAPLPRRRIDHARGVQVVRLVLVANACAQAEPGANELVRLQRRDSLRPVLLTDAELAVVQRECVGLCELDAERALELVGLHRQQLRAGLGGVRHVDTHRQEGRSAGRHIEVELDIIADRLGVDLPPLPGKQVPCDYGHPARCRHMDAVGVLPVMGLHE